MQQILVGRFQNPKDAEVAMHLLVADGIPQDSIALTAHGVDGRRSLTVGAPAPGILHGISDFFDHLFNAAGKADDRNYADPVPPGGAVIVVSVTSGRKSQLAHAALADMGASEIEKR